MPRKKTVHETSKMSLDDVSDWGLWRGSNIIGKSKISLLFVRALVPNLGWSQVNIM